MNSLETDDQLTIVNRSMEHRISKKLIPSIPYFVIKVELNFDEKTLKLFLDWLESGNMLIKMDFVINMCTIMDYFGVRDTLIQNCHDYFGRNFCSEYLPVVIPQVTSTSALINSDTLDAFICRFFLKIANTSVWFDYPIETIEYICALDLMIHSEYQVFNAINKWVNFKADSRKCYLERLLKLVRWCHLEDNDLSKIKENELYKLSAWNLERCLHNNCKCSVDRTKQGYFIVLEKLCDNKLRVKVLDRNFKLFINQVIQLDNLLPLNLFHGKYVSDIPFDSGKQMIRIDWKQNKYRLLDLKLHYHEIFGFIFGSHKSLESCIEKTEIDERSSWLISEFLLLEAADKFIQICYGKNEFRCWENPSINIFRINKFYNCHRFEHNYLATVLDNNVYVLTRNLEFFQFNIDRDLEFKNIGLKWFCDLQFDNLILTCKQAGDDGVILIDKFNKYIFCFNVSTQEWKYTGVIDARDYSGDLKTFTFGFISTD